MTCTGTYTVTDADGLAGSVTNTALAHGTTPGGTTVDSPPDSRTIGVATSLALSLTKSADDSRLYEVGDQVTYTYTVTNSGDGTLTGIPVVDDRATGITCQATTLAPGASTTCTGTYTVTEQDAGLGNVTNIAFARGQSGDTTVESPPDSARVDVVTNRPALRLEKSVDDSRPYRVGERITYTYTVANTGNTELSDVTVVDDRVTDVTCQATTLAPGRAPRARVPTPSRRPMPRPARSPTSPSPPPTTAPSAPNRTGRPFRSRASRAMGRTASRAKARTVTSRALTSAATRTERARTARTARAVTRPADEVRRSTPR
ncbi:MULTISPECIES: DUF11 domain-containing protein [unclassified Streptomyces]|uniref:DUF11 domain-containing protein n=1 Tax=unclassified Streptomyces TaxID=2593676 RepID=UPI0021562A21|nr:MULTISPECIES: DUF11 domain-containing protein [unclassified Streptomyces]